jgi:HEAT repeat protein
LFRGPSGRTPGQQPQTTPPPGQGGIPEKQPLPVVYPGGGPQIAFNEERWEFWWEYNQDLYENVRERLLAAEAPQQGLRPFFVPSLEDKRRDLIPFLVTRALKDENDQVRSAAVYSLAKIGDPFTVPYLEHLASSVEMPRQPGKVVYESNLAVRTNTIVALGIMQSSRAIGTLKEILQNDRESEELRSYAATSLGMIGGTEASAILKQALEPRALKQHPFQLRLSLCYAIGLTRDPDNAPFVRTLATSNEIEEYLQKALLVQALGQLNDSGAQKLLQEQLRSKETQVRRSAVLALGASAQASDKELIEALMRTARSDSDTVTMSFAYIALGRIAKGGNETIERFLVEELNRVPQQRRAFVVLGLGLTGDKEQEERLIRFFAEEKELSLRAATAVAMGLMGGGRSAAPLRAALETPDPVFRSYVALALGMLGDKASVKKLKQMVLDEVDVELIYRAAIALGLIGDRTVLPDMIAEYKKKPEQLVRASYVYALGKLGGSEYIPELTAVVQDAKETDLVRAFAVLALGLVGEAAAIPTVSQLTRDTNYTIGATFIIELWNLL